MLPGLVWHTQHHLYTFYIYEHSRNKHWWFMWRYLLELVFNSRHSRPEASRRSRHSSTHSPPCSRIPVQIYGIEPRLELPFQSRRNHSILRRFVHQDNLDILATRNSLPRLLIYHPIICIDRLRLRHHHSGHISLQ